MKMTKEKIIITCGVWLMILPFLGFPSNWKMALTVLTGVIVVYLGSLNLKNIGMLKSLTSPETRTETFTETA